MLENTITLALPNGGNPVNAGFTRIDVFQNRSLYHGPNHSNTARETLGFYRTYPKKTGNFLGVMKSATKITKDLSVLNAVGEPIVSPMIADISFSVPVGATAAEVDILLDHLEAQVEGQRAILKRTLFGPEI